MGETVIEKIIRNNVGKTVKPGDIVTVNVDRVMIHDIFIPFVAEKFEEMGFTKLWDPDKAVLIYDHLVPASPVLFSQFFKYRLQVSCCLQIQNNLIYTITFSYPHICHFQNHI